MKLLKFAAGKIMWHISALGTGFFLLALALFAFFAGQQTLFLQLAAALVISFLVALPLKLALYKDRPQKKHHSNWVEKFDAATFPSVHSSRAALIFIILSLFINKTAVSVFLLIISILIAYSRIHLKRHFWQDTLAGYLLGVSEALFIIAIFN